MNADPQPDKVARLIAEEVLRTIYGDDLKGCSVSLDQIGSIIHEAIRERLIYHEQIVQMYETVVQSLNQLSTPPDVSKVTGPNELRSLLSERLDAIHTITSKTIDMTARVKAERATKPEDPL
jgi:hypothetical protein